MQRAQVFPKLNLLTNHNRLLLRMQIMLINLALQARVARNNSILGDARCKPRLYDLYSRHVARRRTHAPAIHAASYVDHEKRELHGFLFLCIAVALFVYLG